MTKMFVSYSHFDKKIVKSVVKELHDLGFDVWIDSRGLRGGSSWRKEIEKAINDCDILLLFMSSRSLKSRYVQKELRLAVEIEKPIIPLRLEEAQIPHSLNSILLEIQWIAYGEKGWKSKLLVALDSPQPLSRTKKSSHEYVERQRRFEGAMPRVGQVKQRTEVRGMISLPGSIGLRRFLPEGVEVEDEITKQDVKTSNIPLEFTLDSTTGKPLALNLYVTVNAPDFDVEQQTKKIRIPPNLDTGVFSFFLTPRVVSRHARVMLELFKDVKQKKLMGSLTVTTEVKALRDNVMTRIWQLASLPLAISPAIPKIKQNSTRGRSKKLADKAARVIKDLAETTDADELADILENPLNITDLLIEKLPESMRRESSHEKIRVENSRRRADQKPRSKKQTKEEIRILLIIADPQYVSLEDIHVLWQRIIDPLVDWYYETRRMSQLELARKLVSKARQRDKLSELANEIHRLSQNHSLDK